MNRDLFNLAERLVLAVEAMSQDVKDISGYMRNMNYSVSSFLNTKERNKDSSSAHCDGQEATGEREHSSIVQNFDETGHDMSAQDVGSDVSVHLAHELDMNDNRFCCDEGRSDEQTQDGQHSFPRGNSVSEKTSNTASTTSSTPKSPNNFNPAEGLDDSQISTWELYNILSSVDEEGRDIGDRSEQKNTEKTDAERISEQNAVQPNQNRAEDIPEASRNIKQKRSSRKNISRKKGVKKTRKGPFSCQTCGKQFRQILFLENHVRVHTGEKPFKCGHCDKAFAVKNNLKIHFRVHTGEKPYFCHICGTSFSQSSSLKHHIRVHTGERPYQCASCDKTFKTRCALLRHTKLHLPE